MDTRICPIIDFFNGLKQSVIPLFQRPYSWKDKEWLALWEDIMEQYNEEHKSNHFMGAIVTMPTESVPVGVSKWAIIDGQQRLTTLAIILCAIRDLVCEDSDELKCKARIENHYLINDGYDEWDELKILPTQVDRKDFTDLVRKRNISEESRIQQAHFWFMQKILKEDDISGDRIKLVKLLETIEKCLLTVNINLSDSDDPYLVFESLNFKGSPLSQADLVRNYFLMRFRYNHQQRIHHELWSPMEETLKEDLSEFIRHYLISTIGSFVSIRSIYSELKKRLKNMNEEDLELELISL